MHLDFVIINLQLFSPANSCVHAQHLLKMQQLSSSAAAFGCWSVWVWSCLVFQSKGASRWQLWLSLHLQSPWRATGQRFTVCCEEEQQEDRAIPWASCTTSPISFWRLVALPWLASLLVLVGSPGLWILLLFPHLISFLNLNYGSRAFNCNCCVVCATVCYPWQEESCHEHL